MVGISQDLGQSNGIDNTIKMVLPNTEHDIGEHQLVFSPSSFNPSEWRSLMAFTRNPEQTTDGIASRIRPGQSRA